jgi:hypothetical protein
MILTADYSASRLAVSRPHGVATEADTDGLHALIGTATAGMLVPQLDLLPGTTWMVVFGAGPHGLAHTPSVPRVGGRFGVFETSIDAGPPLHVHITARTSASTCSTANCRSAAAAKCLMRPEAASCSCPAAACTSSVATNQSARLLIIAVPGGIEDCFRQINNAPDDQKRHRIGELRGIRVVAE